jgi:alkylmercury lyase
MMSIARPTTEEATEAWTKMAAKGKEVFSGALIHLLEELTKGEPVSRKRASEVLGVPGEKVDRMFKAIAAAGGQLDGQGNFIGMVLTLEPTRHSFRVNGNDMYAWCSLDTILLPGILEAEGEIESKDPVTGETIRLTVTADRVVEVEPAGAVTSVFVPGKTPSETKDGEPVIGAESDVCRSMLFYASPESAEQALENYPNIAIFTIEEAFNLALKTWTEPARQLRQQHA